MAFVYEKLTEEDEENWLSKGFRDFNGDNFLEFSSKGYWSVDRKKNAYLNCIGKGGPETPIIFELWWKDQIIRIWTEYSKPNDKNEICWEIIKIFSPKEFSNIEDEILTLIRESILSDRGYYSLFVSDKTVVVKRELNIMFKE